MLQFSASGVSSACSRKPSFCLNRNEVTLPCVKVTDSFLNSNELRYASLNFPKDVHRVFNYRHGEISKVDRRRNAAEGCYYVWMN